MRPSAWKWVAVAGLVVIGVYFALPTMAAQDVLYVTIGLGSTTLMAVGMRRNNPADRLSWYLLMAGNLCSVVGDAIENVVYGLVLNRPVPSPSIADAFYLAAYPFFFVGIARLCRGAARAGRRESYTDAAIVTIGAVALSWHFLMGSYFHDPALGVFAKGVFLAYPAMDVGIFFILARSLFFGTARLAFHKILFLALSSMLVADVGFDLLVLHGGYATGDLIDAGWLVNYVLMGVAALHPSVVHAPGQAVVGPELDTQRRIPILVLAGYVAPGILLIASMVGATVDVPVLATTSMVLFALVVLRMSWLFESVRAQSIQARQDAAALVEALRVREALETELRHQAFHDTLTGLANRALLHDRVGQALELTTRSPRMVALCFCDLDGFKMVNDSLGHQFGDDLLAATSARLLSIVRPGDTVARLGGDEFALLMTDIDSPDSAVGVAERIVSVLREPVEIAGRQITMSVSVGVAFGRSPKTPEQLLSEADTAMYEAKAKGKSRLAIFEASMHLRSLQRLEVTNAFIGSLERSEFFLHYQPLFSLADGHLEGFEALVRWQHPTLGLVPPGTFIPVAEETGFIVDLGRWVLETACEVAARWPVSAEPLTISVNLSGVQMQDRNLCDDIRTALSVSGLPPSRLILEFTESILLADSAEITQRLAELKTIGARLALDDFGTGYSSLAYLRRFPLDVLKIDKSFVDPLGEPGEEGTAFMSTIIAFAQILGLRTVAEGIEHPVQRQMLSDLGCDSAQGFLLARPLTTEQVAAFISSCGTTALPASA